MKHLTIRNLPMELAGALERERQLRGTSLNRTVIELLSQSLGVGWPPVRSNGLGKLGGTWNDEDLAEFEEAIQVTERIDEELWR